MLDVEVDAEVADQLEVLPVVRPPYLVKEARVA